MKKIMILALMLLATALFAQRSYVKSGTYTAGDTISITSTGNVSGSYSHVGYDSIKYWLAASDSVSVFVDRISKDPTLGTTAMGSWTVIDSLVGTTNNGTGTGYGNLILSTLWKAATGTTGWNYGYRIRVRATGNPATSGTYKFGWLCK
jgi:hypothetical protein